MAGRATGADQEKPGGVAHWRVGALTHNPVVAGARPAGPRNNLVFRLMLDLPESSDRGGSVINGVPDWRNPNDNPLPTRNAGFHMPGSLRGS